MGQLFPYIHGYVRFKPENIVHYRVNHEISYSYE